MSASAVIRAAPLHAAFPPRTMVRIAMLGLAFLLPSLGWKQAAGGAVLAWLFTVAILPQISPQETRGAPAIESEAPGSNNIRLYTISVLLLILIFRHQLAAAAAAWAIMALGDSAASLAGRRIPRQTLPWNPQKTWAGFAAFLIAGTVGSAVLLLWVQPSISHGKAVIVSALAALVGAAVESIPIALDENLTVPLICGGFVFCALLTSSVALDGNLPYLRLRVPIAILVNLTFALAALKLKTASRSGAGLGFVLGVMVYLGWGWKSFLVLFAFFALGSLATRLGSARKAERGIAQERGGARTWREALANVGPGAFFALLVILTGQEQALLVAFIAAFAEAAGDTVSSEIGQWLSPRAYLITTLREVPAGENGAVSLAGSAAGVVASASIVALGWALGLAGNRGAAVAFGAAVGGNLFDSLLGATLERRGLVTNGIVNFTGATLAAALALVVTLR